MKKFKLSLICGVLFSANALLLPQLAHSDEGKLLATGGVSELEGAGGGGLTPWALITGYGTRDAIGGSTHYTHVGTANFTLDSVGAAVGIYDRIELSVAQMTFNTGFTGTALGLGADFSFRQDIIGLKVKVAGDAVYDQDSFMPQIAVGLQYKRNKEDKLVRALGAKSNSGTDVYVAATKILLDKSLLLNGTVRATKANQIGILGFGGDLKNSYHAEFEASAAYLLDKHTAVGMEYRTKPDNLSFAHESNWADFFVAYFPSKQISFTAGYAMLGSIATVQNQNGPYVSVQASF